MTQGNFKRPKVWSNTQMVVYDFEMLERFLQNAKFFDIPSKYMLLAQIYCLAMFSLKIILKHVQKTDLDHSYVEAVIIGNNGKNAMKLASKIGLKLLNNENTNICLLSDKEKAKTRGDDDKKSFCEELKDYITNNKELFELQESYERNTRSKPFTPSDAKDAVDGYINLLWKCIGKRVKQTDLTNSPCAFSEAPAKGIFSIMDRVKKGRESLTIKHLVALTRLAAHGQLISH